MPDLPRRGLGVPGFWGRPGLEEKRHQRERVGVQGAGPAVLGPDSWGPSESSREPEPAGSGLVCTPAPQFTGRGTLGPVPWTLGACPSRASFGVELRGELHGHHGYRPIFPLRCLALPRPSVALLSPADKNAQLLLAWLPGQGPSLQASGHLPPLPPWLQGGPGPISLDRSH